MRLFSYNEIVVLNPSLSYRTGHVAMALARPLYAAAMDGLYIVNRKEFFVSQGPKIFGMLSLGGFSFLLFLGGFASLFNPFVPHIASLVSMLLGLAGLLFVYKKYSDAKKKAPYEKVIPAELVVPWNQVRAITVANIRSVNVGSVMYPTFKEVGDWHIFTWDGREIVVPEVTDPYNTLEYVKNRFGLRI